MTQALPVGYNKSPAMRLVISQGWNFNPPSGGQIAVEKCPFCGKLDFKFYIAVSTDEELEAGNTRDSLYFCHKCQETGNLRKLQEKLGLRIAGVDSHSEWAGKKEKQDDLPDAAQCHAVLLSDADAMDYLLNVRGFTKEIIERQKLGLKDKVYFHKAGETRALVIPYLSIEGNVTFAKYRTLPPAEKDFTCPSGYEAGLYNSPALSEDCKEIIFVEGEADCLALLSHGVENVVGVPGAGVKKHAWIEAVDRIAPQIYILFDSDQAGTKGAQSLASRIGLDKCLKIVLPKGTKDINEFFQKGGTVDGFEELKKHAVLFDVTGVVSCGDALQDLEDKLEGKEDLAPTYTSQWVELNKLLGMEDGDVLDIVGEAKRGKTTFAMNMLDYAVKTYNEPGLLCCLEMTGDRLARKWVSIVTGFEDALVAPGTPEAKDKLSELKNCIAKAKEEQRTREADLYFAYPQLVTSPEDVFKLIRDCIRRYNVRWVCLDNIQRLCDDTLKSQNMRTIHLSQISKGLTKIAKDYKIKMIRIVQPKKIASGAVVTSADVDGSSQIDKDCDAMIVLHRQAIGATTKSAYEEEASEGNETSESFSPQMRVTVGLSRYSSGGSCYLYFDGARSQVRAYDKVQQLQPVNFNGILPMEGAI